MKAFCLCKTNDRNVSAKKMANTYRTVANFMGKVKMVWCVWLQLYLFFQCRLSFIRLTLHCISLCRRFIFRFRYVLANCGDASLSLYPTLWLCHWWSCPSLSTDLHQKLPG